MKQLKKELFKGVGGEKKMADNRSDAEKRELLSSVTTPMPKFPPAWVEANSIVTEPVKGVTNEYAVALTGDDLVPDAKAWADHRAEITPHFFAFLFLALCVENPNLGKKCVLVDKDEKPELYKVVIHAYARQISRIPEPNDAKIIQSYVGGCQQIKLSFLRDLKEAIDKVKKDAEEKRKKKKRRVDEDGEEEEEEEEEEEVPQLPPGGAGVGVGVGDILKTLGNLMFINRQPRPGAISDNSSNYLMDHQLLFDSHPWFRRNDNAPVVAHVTQDDDNISIPNGADETSNKATFTVMPCYSGNGALKGYLIRVFQHDGAWNPGEMIHTLQEEINVRSLNAGNANFRDPWPQYRYLTGTMHPVHKMTYHKWFQLVNQLQPAQIIQTYEQAMAQEASGISVGNYVKPFHPRQVLTLKDALARLRNAGAVVGLDSAYENGNFPQDQRAYKYLSSQVHWANTNEIGLSSQYFPGIKEHGVSEPVLLNLKSQKHVSIEKVSSYFPHFGKQKTSNSIIHMEDEADALQKHCETFTLNTDEYRLAIADANKVCMQKLTSICQLDGVVDSIPISAPLRATLHELQRHQTHLTRDLELKDPAMSFFGNYMAQMMLTYEKTLRIIHTRYSVMCHGLFSCAQRRVGQLLFSILIIGPGALGKGVCSTGFVAKMAVPGTWEKIDRTTAAADQTDRGIYDLIRVCEEIDDDLVNPTIKSANKEKVNMAKSSMTSGSQCIKTFEHVLIPGFGKVRDSRLIHVHTNMTTVGNSNVTAVSADALASRWHREIIHETDIPANELNYKVRPEASKKATDDFRIMQTLSYWTEKSMGIYAICRCPNMRLWDDVSDRMLEYLESHGVLKVTDMETNTARIKELMTPMARQFTIENAINCCWNIKGGPCYGKPFHPSQFKDVAPYLYCTLDIIIFVWTLLSSLVINDDFGDVLLALYEMSTGEKSVKQSNYQLFQTSQRAQFKKTPNPNHNKTGPQRTMLNSMLTDLNYLQVTGNLDKVASNVAPLTKGKIPQNSVVGILKRLSNIYFAPRHGDNARNGYDSDVGADDLLLHRTEEVPKVWLTHDYLAIIREFVIEYRYLYMHDVVIKLRAEGAIGLDSFAGAKKYFYETKKFTDEDIVLLRIMKSDWTFANVDARLKYYRETAKLQNDAQLERILAACITGPRVAGDTESVADAMKFNYVRCVFLFHMIDVEYVAEPGKSNRRKKLNIVTDPSDIQFPHVRSEDDIPQLLGHPIEHRQSYQIRIVDLESRKNVCFAPSACVLFDKQIIIDAFNAAVICAKTPVCKYILGWPHPDNPSKAQTMSHSERFIKSYIAEYARLNPNAENRNNGVIFHRRGYTSTSTAAMIGTVTNDTSNFERIEDLNVHAATYQHHVCGLTDTVRTPTWIRNNYGGVVGSINYPQQLIDEELAEQKKNWDINAFGTAESNAKKSKK
jgi:hypothetical protein